MSKCQVIKSKDQLSGIINIPGDKSISHRSIMISSFAEGEYHFQNFLFSEDCLCTANILRSLGVSIDLKFDTLETTIKGVGLNGLKPTSEVLYAGNSGTSIRLLTGVLAAQKFGSSITGDESIQKRPMKRVIDPLSKMGAHIEGHFNPEKQNTYPPLTIYPVEKLHPIEYELPIASAQVKSAVLFAALQTEGQTKVIEPEQCRDHTERMLKMFNADIKVEGKNILLSGKKPLSSELKTIFIPGDISSAAFFIILGLVHPNANFVLKNVGLNPTRDYLIALMQEMGGDVKIINHKKDYFEPYADIEVKSSKLHNIEIKKEAIPYIIDEIPIIAIAALFATGKIKVTGAKELRVKESDRIKSIVRIVTAMGGEITEFEDGFELSGPIYIKPFDVDSTGDHRIAMSSIIASVASGQPASINDCECIKTSFPTFFEILKQLEIEFDLQ